MLYVGVVGLAGALLADRTATLPQLLGAWLVPTLGWVAGHYGGDYFDRRLDAIAKPHRPIPSGRMPAGTALWGMILCAGVGGALALLLNWRTILLVAAALLLGIAYSRVFKSQGLSGNLVRGSLTAFAFAFGAMMAATWPPPALLPIAAVFWLHDTMSNLVGTLRDVDGDREAGYRTYPVLHGTGRALVVVAGLGGLWVTLAAATIVVRAGGAPRTEAALLVGAATLLACEALIVLARARPLTPETALLAHEILAVERVVLACAFVGLATGTAAVAALAVVGALVTLVLQGAMRSRYEFGSRVGGT
jgi:4-hydroxybenzoate polyprenyltransferase/geranylgeranylglycerol-phosphate geranylgeranyltransferase